MTLCQTVRNQLLRSLAAVALLAFVAAQAICFVHCHLPAGESAEAVPSCHAAAPASDNPTDAQDSMPSEACVTLKTMLSGADAPTIAPPEFHTLYLLSALVFSLEDTASEMAGESRQAHPSDWIFTPEVSLGPAFRSLAPPLAA